MPAIMQEFAVSMNNSKGMLFPDADSPVYRRSSSSCHIGDEFQQAIQTWLSPPDPWENHGIALNSHRNGTSSWFIQSDTFAEWKSLDSLLWIHGKREPRHYSPDISDTLISLS
jgi:hypothetical protein